MKFHRNVVLEKLENEYTIGDEYVASSYAGVTKKTLFFLLMTVVGAFGGFLLGSVNESLYATILILSGILTFIFGLIALTSPRLSKVMGSLYCLFEGCAVGFISLVYGSVLDGAVVTALVSTLMVFAVVATLFLSNIIKVNSKFVKFLLIFSISFILTILILNIIMLVGGYEMSSALYLGVSAISVFLASLYLFFDLETIRNTVESRMPKEYEWYASFGLAFTIVWLYVEILRLVVVIFGNRD